jgi:transcriptional regulator with XRE-family HTH domain
MFAPSPRWTPEDRRRRDPLAQQGCELLGAMVRRRRRQVVLSQRNLATLCGVSQTMISRLETGKLRGINLHNLGRIVGALGGLDETAPIPRHLGPYRWLGQHL